MVSDMFDLFHSPLRVVHAFVSPQSYPQSVDATFSLALMVCCRERFASGSCHNSDDPNAVECNYKNQSNHRHHAATAQCWYRAFCERQFDRTLPGSCDGTAHKFHSSVAIWFWCGCGRCPQWLNTTDIRDARCCHNTRNLGR